MRGSLRRSRVKARLRHAIANLLIERCTRALPQPAFTPAPRFFTANPITQVLACERAETGAKENAMAKLTHTTPVRTDRALAFPATDPLLAKLLLASALAIAMVFAGLYAPAASAQDARPAPSTPATIAAKPAAPQATPAASQPATPHRKRSAFGEAMSQLTSALRDASRQAASSPAAANAEPAGPAAQPASSVDHGTLAVESPP
jgi:hypothetical protein